MLIYVHILIPMSYVILLQVVTNFDLASSFKGSWTAQGASATTEIESQRRKYACCCVQFVAQTLI